MSQLAAFGTLLMVVSHDDAGLSQNVRVQLLFTQAVCAKGDYMGSGFNEVCEDNRLGGGRAGNNHIALLEHVLNGQHGMGSQGVKL